MIHLRKRQGASVGHHAVELDLMKRSNNHKLLLPQETVWFTVNKQYETMKMITRSAHVESAWPVISSQYLKRFEHFHD